jgi:S-adenosylmethionine-diacylglycerol 3-amino-3-carboxypropyl transferase
LQALLGRDREFLRYVNGSVADQVLRRARHAMTTLPTRGNPYLGYVLLGNYRNALPRYLRPERFEAVRRGASRVILVEGPVEEVARKHEEGGFDGFNLSDIFEYVDPQVTERIFSGLLRSARPGARMAYWNLLVPRRCPESLSLRIRPLPDLSRRLHRRDLAWFYGDFIVEEVLPRACRPLRPAASPGPARRCNSSAVDL